jgi:protein involved in polysaccharide export with SLBB domain
VASPAATSTAVQAAASPSAIAIAVERVDGTVRTLADGTLVLTSGRSISVPASVIVVRSTVGSAADLHPGDYVAITGVRQPDNTLLASIVTVFPPSLGQVAPGQRPLPQGNLMTNATIDQVQGNSFTVSFPGGGAQVQLAPGAQVTRLVDAGISDVHPGDQVSVQVVDGTARLLTIESSSTQQP